MVFLPFSFFENKRNKSIADNSDFRRRAGITPVIATTIILAITVTLGLALYSFVNSQSNVATQSFAQEATDYINYRNDRFVITSLGFQNFQNNVITANVFNSGNTPVTINRVLDGTDELNYCPAPITDSHPIKPKEIGTVTFTFTPCDGQPVTPPVVIHVKIISEAGSYQTYFQKYGVSS